MLKTASALLLSVLAGSAGAQTFLSATLNNASENPPTVPTTSTGQPRPASFGTGASIRCTCWPPTSSHAPPNPKSGRSPRTVKPMTSV